MLHTPKTVKTIDNFFMFDEYQRKAMRTANKELPADEMLLNAVMGMCGEAGEAIDLLKKHRAQGAPLDIDRLAGEVGDCLWYIAEFAEASGISLEEIAQRNISKLKNRYPKGFDAECSNNRAEGDV